MCYILQLPIAKIVIFIIKREKMSKNIIKKIREASEMITIATPLHHTTRRNASHNTS